MNDALAPAFDPYVSDPVAGHLSGLFVELLADKYEALRGVETKVIRVLAAAPDSPVIHALCGHMGALIRAGYEFRFVFAENEPKPAAEHFITALENIRPGLSRQDGVLRLVGGPAARKVNESLVLGGRTAWIGAPLPHKSEVQTEFGQTIQRPSAVHLAAMGFESVRVGSLPWTLTGEEIHVRRPAVTIIRSLYDCRPGETPYTKGPMA